MGIPCSRNCPCPHSEGTGGVFTGAALALTQVSSCLPAEKEDVWLFLEQATCRFCRITLKYLHYVKKINTLVLLLELEPD